MPTKFLAWRAQRICSVFRNMLGLESKTKLHPCLQFMRNLKILELVGNLAHNYIKTLHAPQILLSPQLYLLFLSPEQHTKHD